MLLCLNLPCLGLCSLFVVPYWASRGLFLLLLPVLYCHILSHLIHDTYEHLNAWSLGFLCHPRSFPEVMATLPRASVANAVW